MNRISLVEYECAECKTKFKEPYLGDFCYGMFLLWSAPNSCVFLGAIEDNTYEEVMSLIERKKQSGIAKNLDTEFILWNIYGELACDTDGFGRPYHLGSPPCHNCGSRRRESVNTEIVGWANVSDVSHGLWFSLSEQEKEDRLERAISELLNRKRKGS